MKPVKCQHYTVVQDLLELGVQVNEKLRVVGWLQIVAMSKPFKHALVVLLSEFKAGLVSQFPKVL